jgi:hypothetical protein
MIGKFLGFLRLHDLIPGDVACRQDAKRAKKRMMKHKRWWREAQSGAI